MKYLYLVLFVFTFILIGCSKQENKSELQQNKENGQKSELVRDDNVAVASLDANKDGNVYQCPMKEHYNVISDESGTCPLCMMDLKQETVEVAQKNLDSKKE